MAKSARWFCVIVPDEARRFGFYIWHLYNRETIEKEFQRGIYRLKP